MVTTLDPQTDVLAFASEDDSEDENPAEEAGQTPTTTRAGTDPATAVTDHSARIKELESQLAEARQWEGRFKGVQPVVQQNVELAKKLKAEKDALETQLAHLRISLLPDEQQQPELQNWQNNVALRQMQESRQQEAAAMEQVLRGVILQDLSTRHGVPLEDLEDFTDPFAAEKYAKKVAELRNTTKKAVKRQQRVSDGADDFGDATVAAIPSKQPETRDEADQAFAAAMRQLMNKRR